MPLKLTSFLKLRPASDRSPEWRASQAPLHPPSRTRVPEEGPAPILDHRLVRDLWSRRTRRLLVRGAGRVGLLLFFDSTAAVLAVAVALSVTSAGAAAPIRDFYPLLCVLTILGQGTLGTYGWGGARSNKTNVLLGLLVAGVAWSALSLGLANLHADISTHAAILASLCLLVLAGRPMADRVIRRAHRLGVGRRNAIIIGEAEEVWRLISHLRRSSDFSIRVVGHLAPEPDRDPTALGGIDQLAFRLEELQVDYVIVSASVAPAAVRAVEHETLLHGALLSVIPREVTSPRERTVIREICGWPAMRLRLPAGQLIQLVVKRTLDVSIAATGLVLCAPVFLVIAIAIKLDSPGPVFFRQRRPGLGGRRFAIFKFRTMQPDAEHVLSRDAELYQRYLDNGCKLTPPDDPRMSRLGAVLRRTSLDELPQLLNVLLGDMSLVGPRPVVGPELAYYGEDVRLLLSVRPGITGSWQVNGRSALTIEERRGMDLDYVRQWSLLMDLRILVRTIPVVLGRDGAV